MRTGTLTRPKEMVPDQSERAMSRCYPAREVCTLGLGEIQFSRRSRTSYEASPPNGGLGSRPATSRPRHVYGQGISLWKMWKKAAQPAVSSGLRVPGRLCGTAHVAGGEGLRPTGPRVARANRPKRRPAA